MAGSDTTGSSRVQSKSPKKTNNSPPSKDTATEAKTESNTKGTKGDASSNAEAAKPLAPPPRPAQSSNQQGNTPDYFANQPQAGGSLSLEPNPFEQSFGNGNGGPETPGGTKLPSVASLTSPSSLLPGSAATPFNWGGGSLRTGPLSPAMLSGPATNDYFSESHHLRGGFPTPNESSLRSGLTPGGSGSMFPAPSPNSQALYNQLQSGGATPSTLDFHRTAMSAAAKRDGTSTTNGAQPQNQNQNQTQSQQQPTSQPQEMGNGAPAIKSEPKSIDPHDNAAANGLFMLAQGAEQRNGASNGGPQYPPVHSQVKNQSPHMGGPTDSNASARGGSEGSGMSEEPEQGRPNTRGKGGKKNTAATNGRRKADDSAVKAPPAKKAKANNGGSINGDMGDYPSDMDDDVHNDEDGPKGKMTDEEKRKNFLERNRVAALKCRQRKKQWLQNLQTKVEMFSSENDALTAQITQLREEVVNLKTLLLAHKDCPVTQQQGLHSAYMNQVVEPYNAQMNPYGMAGPPMGQQPVMAGQGPRRYS